MTARRLNSKAVLLAWLAGLVAAIALFAVSAESARGAAPITHFHIEPGSTQAGGHPDLLLETEMLTPEELPPIPCGCAQVRDITINTPPGFTPAPRRLPQCTAAEFSLEKCSVDAQIGVAYVTALGNRVFPVYNMVPQNPNQAGLVANPAPLINSNPIYTSFSARTEDLNDFGLEAKIFGIPIPLKKISTVFWGVPGDPSHDILRFPPEGFPGSPLFGNLELGCGGNDPTAELWEGVFPEVCNGEGTFTSTNSPEEPLLSNPTNCSGPRLASIETFSNDLVSETAETLFPAVTGCDLLSFDPSLAAQPTTTSADSSSGLDVNLDVPQRASPNTPAPSQIKQTSVTLPPGFTVNPSAADGKTACTEAEARFNTREPAACPEFSKIGTLVIESTSLPGSVPGNIYLGEPLPGNRYRIFLIAEGFGLNVKIPGTVTPDPVTGQLRTVVPTPPAPVQRVNLHFFGAERGLLATPEQCGTYAVASEFVPWAEPEVPNQSSTQFFQIESGPGGAPCPPPVRPFDPNVMAGVTDNTGGAHTKFVFDLTRPDGDQGLSGVTVAQPTGLSASLAGIPYCPEATIAALSRSSYLGATEMAAPACERSQVGTSSASAGSGSKPLALPGRVYLAGPYKGGPISLVAVTPAVAGPYDLGNVVVRIAAYVDPITGRVSAVSDPLPRIVEGIPVRLREVLVELDRQNFILNPTNCEPLSVDTTVSGDQGGVANRSNHFQVANCGALDFAPKLRLELRGSTKRRGHPALRSVFRGTPGGANLGGAVVALPAAEQLDNAHIGTVCTRVRFARNECPKRSVVGNAVAETRLLDEPLRGKAYLRSSDNPLPDLVVALRGQIDVDLVGRIDSTKAGGLRTTFDTAPDAPVDKFVLSLYGGKRGLLINSEDLCKSPKRASVKLVGQNGKELRRRTPLRTSCGKKARKKRAKAHNRPTSARKAG